MSVPDLTGFTLVIDGNPEEVGRILAAFSEAYAAVERDAAVKRDREVECLLGPRAPFRLRASSLHGAIHVRHAGRYP